MKFIPPGEKVIETKKCRISGQEFFITDKDLGFYDKISPIFAGKKYLIPSPTLCPDERQRRRLCFRNERKFYHRKCDKRGNQIISIYSPDKPFQVYDQKVWWSDDWNPFDYGKKFDFEKRFFDNFLGLSLIAPRPNNWIFNCQNCEFAHCVGWSKDCYMTYSTDNSEKSFYSGYCDKNTQCIDCYGLKKGELSYECIDSEDLYNCSFCQNCYLLKDCIYCIQCKKCSDCFGCFNLENKNNCFFNTEYSEKEYKEKVFAYKKNTNLPIEKFLQKKILFQSYSKNNILQSENIIGNDIRNSKNIFESFDIGKSENIKYVTYAFNSKDIMDGYALGNVENCYEIGFGSEAKSSAFCQWLEAGPLFSYYCEYCVQNTQNCFGCISLKKAKNSILNTPYSAQEYESLCGKIIDHMKSTEEWGEFFPHELSPFGYDESVAQEYFPMTEKEVINKGWNWKGEEETSSYHGQYYSPLQIDQYDEKNVGYEVAKKNIDELLNGILQCEITKRPFKVIRQELAFYIENHLPIPIKHPDQRHKERMGLRNPRQLRETFCAQCREKIITTYPPESPEKIVCESCYQKLVY